MKAPRSREELFFVVLSISCIRKAGGRILAGAFCLIRKQAPLAEPPSDGLLLRPRHATRAGDRPGICKVPLGFEMLFRGGTIQTKKRVQWLALALLFLFSPLALAETHESPGEKAKETARATWGDARKKLAFPCDLTQFKAAPKLTLSGENHADAYCRADRGRQLTRGAHGQCFVGVEGISCLDDAQVKNCLEIHGVKATPDARVFGYEDPFAYGLGLLLAQDLEFHAALAKKDGKTLANAKRGLLIDGLTNPYLVEVFRKMSKKDRPFADPDAEKIAKVFETNLKSSLKGASDALAGLSADHPWNQKDQAYKKVVHAWTRAYVDMAETDAYRTSKLIPSNTRELVESHLAGKDYVVPLEIFLLEWRNLFMAKNIAALYCEAAREGKELHLIVGNAHVPGLEALLKQMSGGLVPVEKRNSREEIQKLLTLNRRAATPPYEDKAVTVEVAPKFDGGLPELIVAHRDQKRFVIHLGNGSSSNPSMPGGRNRPLWTAGTMAVFQKGAEVAIEPKDRAWFLAEIEKAAETNPQLRESWDRVRPRPPLP
jgi:hypothetical protein